MERYVIHVTKQCNMNCLYCYEKDKTSTYTWEEIKAVIDDLIEYRTTDEFTIEFLGGEPMIAWDYIKDAYEYLEECNQVSIPEYAITSNGTIMNEEIADYISKNQKIRWAISLDGHLHGNQLRVFKDDNKNSYTKVMENIALFNRFNIHPSVHMVTHPYNVAFLKDSIDHLYAKGIRNIDPGIIESTMTIDQHFADRFISEIEKVSRLILEGKYPELRIGILEWLKPKNDIRSYIKDENGRVLAESYGRSGKDISHQDEKYDILRCENSEISELIYYIRETVYKNHQALLKGGDCE